MGKNPDLSDSCCKAFFSVRRFGTHVSLFCNHEVLATGSSLLDPTEVEARFILLADAANASPDNQLGDKPMNLKE